MSAPLLEIRGLEVRYPAETRWFGPPRRWARAVDGVDLEIAPGETLALVGESGCGKTTLGRAVLGLAPCSSGILRFRPPPRALAADPRLGVLGPGGVIALERLGQRDWKPVRRALAMVFQDPATALDPRLRAWRVVAEPMQIHHVARGNELRRRADQLLERVGIDAGLGERFPHQFSGGQRQRLGIARALSLDPALVICDEAVAALDVSVKAQILELLLDLQRERGLSYLFISHDLPVVAQIAQRTAVMYAGRLVEVGPTAAMFAAPRHPYTRALLAATPSLDPQRRRERLLLPGEPPDPVAPPSGCRFHPRCPLAEPRCSAALPDFVPGPTRAACLLADALP